MGECFDHIAPIVCDEHVEATVEAELLQHIIQLQLHVAIASTGGHEMTATGSTGERTLTTPGATWLAKVPVVRCGAFIAEDQICGQEKLMKKSKWKKE